ncbi:hypothetical protein ACFL1B_05005 [Nanoarchaeota archaeon]
MDSEIHEGSEKVRKELQELTSRIADIHDKSTDKHVELTESIAELNKNIQRLILVFEKAADILGEDSTGAKLEQLIKQDTEIAKGLIAIADLIKQKPEPKPLVQPPIQPPTQPPPHRTMPPQPGQPPMGPTGRQIPSPMTSLNTPLEPKELPAEPPKFDPPPSPGEVPAPPKKGFFKK